MMAELEVADKECKDDKYGQKGKYYDYQIKRAAECLTEAEQIKKDKGIMPYVAKCLESEYKAQKRVISSIQDIRDAAQENNHNSDDEY